MKIFCSLCNCHTMNGATVGTVENPLVFLFFGGLVELVVFICCAIFIYLFVDLLHILLCFNFFNSGCFNYGQMYLFCAYSCRWLPRAHSQCILYFDVSFIRK